jgi:hypothetical protein
VSKKTGKQVAVKQILKNAMDESQKKELKYGQFFFKTGGEPQEKFKNYPGLF